eukprot:PITA_13008
MVGIVLTGKENYPEWSRMIKHTLIFSEFWKGVCVKEGDNDPVHPTSNKEIVIWENKNNKAYELITSSINEEVSHHISSYSTTFEALQKLKEIYESHSTLEVVQLMIKLFTLELQNNDPLSLASEVKSIIHDIKSTKVELYLISFLKGLYPTYSNYLESLQANGNLKDITFDSLVKKFAEREKAFGKKKTPESSQETMCLAHKENRPAQDSIRGRGGRRGRGRYFRGRGGRHSQGEKVDLHCIHCKRNGSHDASTCKLPWDKIEHKRNKQKGKTDDTDKGKTPESTHYVEAQYQSKIKPSGLGTIRFKLPGLPYFLLDHVLYLPQLKRNLLSLVHICQQGHSIHMFDGKLEVRKSSDHSLVMRGIEEERLLKLQGTSAHAQHFSYNSHHEEGTRNSNRQNGDDVDDSNSPVDMDVSYDCELNLSIDFEPTSFKDATSHDEWKEVMQKEYDSLIKNGTWKLVDPPFGTKPIGCKWVYKNKYKANGSLDKHKSRLVEKAFA